MSDSPARPGKSRKKAAARKEDGATPMHDPTPRHVKEIIVIYTIPGDPSDRVMRIMNEAGQVINGVLWNTGLVRKLRYQHSPTNLETPDLRPGTKGWRVRRPADELLVAAPNLEAADDEAADDDRPHHCVWLHDEDCNWDEYCPE